MQGWRKSQEDTHIAKISLPNNNMLFGVFDGHGGKVVSLYVEEMFLGILEKNENY